MTMAVHPANILRLRLRKSNVWPVTESKEIAITIIAINTRDRSLFSLSRFSMIFAAPWTPSTARPLRFAGDVITRGVDLNSLIGQEFEVQGVRFKGTEECRPCYWMDEAVAPGAEKFLKGRGGLRAQILCDGILRVTAGRRVERA